MGYADRYTALKQRIKTAAGSRASQLGVAETPTAIALMRSSAGSQSRYLRWLAVGAGLQVIEILVLAHVHYVYFPPAAVTLLRLVSSFSTVVVILAIASSRKLFTRLEHPAVASEVARIRATTSVIFLLALAVSLAMCSYLAVSPIGRQTPPIFRAVLMSTVLTLPLMTCSTFLVYHLKSWSFPRLSPWFRWLSLLSGLSGITLIVLDLPVGYLVVRLIPVVLFARACWYGATGASLFALLTIRITELRAGLASLIPVLDASSTALIGFACLDLTFYLALEPGRRALTWIPLFGFVAHKLLHALVVSGVKETTRLLIRVRPYFPFQPRYWAREVERRLSLLGIGLVVSVVLILPIFMLGRGLLFWRSLEGEEMRIAPLLVIGMCAWLVLRAIWTIRLVGETLGARGSRSVLFLSLVQVVVIAILSVVLPRFWRSSSYDLLLVTVGVDLLFSMLGIAVLHVRRPESYAVRPRRATEHGSLTLLSLDEFLRHLLHSGSGTTSLHWIEASADVSATYFRDGELAWLAREIGQPIWGTALNPRSVIVVTTTMTPSEIDTLHRRWKTGSSAVIRRLRVRAITPSIEPLEALRLLLDETQTLEASLLPLLRARNSSPRAVPTLAKTAHALLIEMRDRPDAAIRKRLADELDIHCLHSSDHWRTIAAWPPELQLALRRFFLAWRSSGDLLVPQHRRDTEAHRVVHLVRHDSVALVICVGTGQRTTILHPLRQLCLETNIAEIVRTGKAAA